MKKLLVSVLVGVFLFTGCGKKFEMPKVYEFQGLKWGSSLEECLESLGITEDDVIIKLNSQKLPAYREQVLTYDTKAYGKDATIKFVFLDDCMETEISLGLIGIEYSFKENVSGAEWISFVNKDIISQGFKTRNAAFPEEEILTISSDEKTLADIKDQALKERSVEIWKQTFPTKRLDDFKEETVLEDEAFVTIGSIPRIGSVDETAPVTPRTFIVNGTNAAIVQYAVNHP